MPLPVKFIAAPRKVVEEGVGEGIEWRHLGERWLEQTRSICPVGDESAEGWKGPHLRDTLELRVVTGSDPRLMVGTRTKGDVLGYVIEGTPPHPIDPVNASVLRFSKGGTIVFAKHVDHPGHPEPNNFPMEAIQTILGGDR